MASFTGKTVFITGASSGIGQSTALAFAAEGARLLLCARRADRLTELTPKLQQAGAAEIYTFKLDVQDRSAVESTLAALPDAWKAIDILVNNAGLSRGLTKLWEDDPQNWQEMIDTNIFGLLFVTKSIVAGMVQRGSGHVINLGSIAGHQTYPNGSVYCASKAAERSITDGLRMDLLGTGVKVTTVDPGLVETEFSSVRFRGDAAKAANVYKDLTPLTPEDIADTIVWTASRPAHVQIQTVLLTPLDQASVGMLNRKPKT